MYRGNVRGKQSFNVGFNLECKAFFLTAYNPLRWGNKYCPLLQTIFNKIMMCEI